MKSLNPRISKLKELMEMEERRAILQEQLEQHLTTMNALKDALFEDAAPSPARSSSPSPNPVGRPKGSTGPRKKGGRARRGELKSQIVSALSAAGSAGVRVTELAKELGVKAVNVHSWFHTATRRHPQIKKVSRGQYRLDGELSNGSSQTESTSSTSTRGQSGARTSKGAGRRGKGTKRGALSKMILDGLTEAGAKGTSVRDLAAKLNVPYKNIYIWFSTTGKKNPKVKKTAPATYKLNS